MEHDPLYFPSDEYAEILKQLKSSYNKRNKILIIISRVFNIISLICVILMFVFSNKFVWIFTLILIFLSGVYSYISMSHVVEQDLEAKLNRLRNMEKFKGSIIYDKYVDNYTEFCLYEIRKLRPTSLRLI